MVAVSFKARRKLMPSIFNDCAAEARIALLLMTLRLLSAFIQSLLLA